MKKLLGILIIIFSWSCDDGNIDVNEFDFEGISISTQNCNAQIVFSKINEQEALIIKVNSNQEDLFFEEPKTFPLVNGGSQAIVYRIFDTKPTSTYFCQSIPPINPKVLSEWLGSGILTLTTFKEKGDDNDGVDEANDLVESDPLYDTDNDNIPNYIDQDDDGDGILTKNEDLDNDKDFTNDDTDNDGIPNYLDDDDDGDGTLTINESFTDDADNDTLPDYLDNDSTTPLTTPNLPISNKYFIPYFTEFLIVNLELVKDGASMRFPNYNYGRTENLTKEIEETTP